MNDSTNPSTGRRRKKSRLGRILFVAVILIAGGTWYGVRWYRAKAAAQGEYITAAVDRGDIEDLVSSTGTLQPRDYVDVGAQVSGQIEDIFVEVGDEVKEGQKLVSIDATTSQARMDANTAQMESAQTSLISQKANRDKAKRDYERQQNLWKDQATTQETLINAQTTYENAERSVHTQELSIAQNEANQRIEAANFKYTTIVAPIAGRIMKLSVKKGQTVNATQSVPNVLQIANLGTMTVQSDVSEADVQRLYKSNPVYFTTLGNPSKRWYSTLKRVEPTPKVQNSVVLYNAVFDIENEGDALMPSMTTQVYFVANEAKNVLKVPMAALQQGMQISRALAAKEQKDGKKPAANGGPAGAGGPPGGPPRNPAAGAAPTTNAAPAATNAAAPAAAGGSAPATAAPATAQTAPAAAPTAGGPANAQGNRQANAPGNRPANGQGAAGGNFGGQRFGGAGGNAGGQRAGGFNGGQGMTPEQREAMIRRMREGGAAGAGGPGGPGGAGAGGAGGAGAGGQRAGGFGGGQGFNGGQGMSAEQREEMMRRMREGGGGAGAGGAGGFGRQQNRQAMGAAQGAGRTAPRRTGTVMVKKADGTLEARRVVVGVTDRVFGEVIEGLKEGDVVIVGKHEDEAAAASPRSNNSNNNNNNFPGGGRGGNNFQGGGNFRP